MRQLYFWLSLVGYFVAYFLMTIFLTSYERVPTKNEIAYKSIGVAFIKNMGLLLAIVFLLVESTTNVNRMRAILSITILLTMICYNIKTRPCYVDKINFFRTASFTCILWTSALVAILSDTNAAQSLGPMAVIYIIVGGWVFIIVCFVAVYYIYYIQPPDHAMMEEAPKEGSEQVEPTSSLDEALPPQQPVSSSGSGWFNYENMFSKWWGETHNSNNKI
jgi:magnesium-transporting ATPase (P-type)